MSEVKVNKISPRTNCGTVQLGDSGDTITIPAGATITNNGTAAGFGVTGAASWDTTVKTASFTGVAGVGYFVNTTSGAITVTLPASPDAGAVIAVKDYANTFDTNNVTLARNGSNIGGQADDAILSTEGVAVTLVYVDATKGWLVTDDGSQTSAPIPEFIVATGGTITCCGNYKIHTFTGPGTFTVCSVGNPAGSTSVDYMVVAGAGGGGFGQSNYQGGGGGGAGGFRESSGAASGCYTASPLGACVSALTVAVQGYPITVGGGGAGGSQPVGTKNPGSNSVFSTITSAGGGGGAGYSTCEGIGDNGGSGGGGGARNTPTPSPSRAGGSGNTPTVSPPQGNDGGDGNDNPAGTCNPHNGGGGGGATVAGTNATNPQAGPGGTGATSSINGTSTERAGGGGGGSQKDSAGTASGGGGAGGVNNSGSAGTANTGGGGGGGGQTAGGSLKDGGAGGSGIVIIRYKFQ